MHFVVRISDDFPLGKECLEITHVFFYFAEISVFRQKLTSHTRARTH